MRDPGPAYLFQLFLCPSPPTYSSLAIPVPYQFLEHNNLCPVFAQVIGLPRAVIGKLWTIGQICPTLPVFLSIKFYWSTVMPTCLGIFNVCFHAPMEVLSSCCKREQKDHKTWNIYSLSHYRIFVDLYTIVFTPLLFAWPVFSYCTVLKFNVSALERLSWSSYRSR